MNYHLLTDEKTMTVLNLARNANTINMAGKLVTIFAPALDSFIVINNQSKHLFSTVVFRLLTINCKNDIFNFRRDLQKLRHTRLAPLTICQLVDVRTFGGTNPYPHDLSRYDGQSLPINKTSR